MQKRSGAAQTNKFTLLEQITLTSSLTAAGVAGVALAHAARGALAATRRAAGTAACGRGRTV